MCRLGWLTVSEPVPVVGGVLVPWAVAVLTNVPDVCAVVWLRTCTLTEAPEPRLPTAQFSVCCAGAVPLIEQVPGPAYAGLIDQLRPVPRGRGSEMVTPVAVPGPALLTVMVKP